MRALRARAKAHVLSRKGANTQTSKHTYALKHTHTHTYMFMKIHMHTYSFLYIYMYIYVCIYSYIYIYSPVYICIHTCIYIFVYIYIHTCSDISVCTSIHARMYNDACTHTSQHRHAHGHTQKLPLLLSLLMASCVSSPPCTGWGTCIVYFTLQVSVRKIGRNYKALPRKMSCADEATYTSCPTCTLYTRIRDIEFFMCTGRFSQRAL